MLQSDPEIVKKFEVFVVFDAISFEIPSSKQRTTTMSDFRIFRQRFQNNQQRKSELCITFFEENVSAFCFKNTSE